MHFMLRFWVFFVVVFFLLRHTFFFVCVCFVSVCCARTRVCVCAHAQARFASKLHFFSFFLSFYYLLIYGGGGGLIWCNRFVFCFSANTRPRACVAPLLMPFVPLLSSPTCVSSPSLIHAFFDSYIRYVPSLKLQRMQCWILDLTTCTYYC